MAATIESLCIDAQLWIKAGRLGRYDSGSPSAAAASRRPSCDSIAL